MAATLLAGCGTNDTKPTSGPSLHTQGAKPDAWGDRHHHHFFRGPVARFLGLTADQQITIASIVDRHRRQHGHPGQARHEELRAILLASTVDGEALKSFIEKTLAQHEDMVDKIVPALVEVRAVLTPQQLDKIASFDPEKGPFGWFHKMSPRQREHKFLQPLLRGLSLNEAQQQAVDALKAEFERRAEQRKDMRTQALAALRAFARSGDEAAFRQLLKAIKHPDVPVAAIVKVATSLDLEQRQAIAARVEKFRDRRHGAMSHGFPGPWGEGG
jgi:Spy/CpxP family protein refolding chaperone